MSKSETNPWYRQPFLQFVMGGVLIFALDSFLYPSQDESTIQVDESSLLNFLQATDKSFNAELSKAKFDQLTDEQRATLEQNYIASEVLYREALGLGLDEYDYVIRTRLIQKMDYLILDTMPEPQRHEEDQLRAWFQGKLEDYRIEPTVSFTHVFFQTKNRTLAEAKTMAEATRLTLQSENIGPDAAQQFGERFYFHRDYVEKSPELIEGHFGEVFQQAVFSQAVSEWSEPVVSEYGVHLVYVTRKQESRIPELEEVAGTVLADYEREQRREARSKAIEKLTEKYQIERVGS